MSSQTRSKPDPGSPTSSIFIPKQTPKPKDDFTTPDLRPNTIFYLAIIKPHTDSHTLIGPVTLFTHLLPHIEDIVSNSPRAIDKLHALRTIEDVWGETEPNHEFAEKGFKTFIVEGQRNTYTVLKVLTEISKDVTDTLPGPVYTVTQTGPLKSGADVEGYAWRSSLVGSWVIRKDAEAAARKAMGDMIGGREGVKVSETWQKGGWGGGILMAMSAEHRWEVNVKYEDQVLKRAKEGFEREGGLWSGGFEG
ncbi:hypothetical protein GQ44DRAFT_631346 [Phaeosphaeriaceae sp. PMI808]|nr:hypothetical protein GQ44DRAFT_631346 [Phaeosphaeriaceae sp. PMI808]